MFTMIATGCAVSAIRAQAITVLPVPGGATSTPVMCGVIVSTALACTGVSSPVKRAVIASCVGRSSSMRRSPPAEAMSLVASSASPLGTRSQSGSLASKHITNRGVPNVE
ncbi:hypothetical protein [Streptomyces violaceus]|uniref:Secreted protein n=1 Tax=Streptomyces violaceus TaxID=1936 RepID=A0ABZ1NMD6_STRVL